MHISEKQSRPCGPRQGDGCAWRTAWCVCACLHLVFALTLSLCCSLHSDYAAFLDPGYESREFAQRLLNSGNGNSNGNDERDGTLSASFPIERRALDALQQLGLPAGGTVAAAAAAASPSLNGANGKETVLYTPMRTSSSASSAGDVSAALSKLSYAVDDLNKQLRTEINTHHAALLIQAGSVSSLEDNLRQIRGGLEEVESSVDRLRRKISMPYAELSSSLERLVKLQRASDLARRASRFVTLARRLDAQMVDLNMANTTARNGAVTPNGALPSTSLPSIDGIDKAVASDSGERALSEAALTLAELGAKPPGLRKAALQRLTRQTQMSCWKMRPLRPSLQPNRPRLERSQLWQGTYRLWRRIANVSLTRWRS